MYPDYIAAINRLDENVGRLAEKLKEKGLYENTVIIYTSDHGSHFKTRNAEYKRSCHDSATHTPLIIAGGPFQGGQRTDCLVSLIDLPPTLLDIAGIPIPQSFSGKSIVPMLSGETERDCVFIQISESQCGRAVRTKKYKYSVRAVGSGFTKYKAKIYFEDYLYDLEKDPCEKVNLIRNKAYKAVRESMQVLLKREMQKAGEAVPTILPAPFVRKK